VRAWQTAEIAARKLKMRDKLVKDERLLYGFGLDQLARILESYPKSRSLLLVGHEPDFSETIGRLIGGGRVVCKKGGLACVELRQAKTLKGELCWLVPPRLIR
jgi:phosphohistidine phosphatase